MSKQFDSQMQRAGWDRITDVALVLETDENSVVLAEYVQVVLVDGSHMEYAPKHGEDASALVEHYKARGWTDHRF